MIKCANEEYCEGAWGRKGEERILSMLRSKFDFMCYFQALSSFCILKVAESHCIWVYPKVYGAPMIKSIISKSDVSDNIAIYLIAYLLLCRKGDRCHQTCHPFMAYFDIIS